ncbi:hypothetical protein ATN88_08145 [Enterovibrio coralii]|uniref:Uncharacterized protein n=2 Tax=Enterovibrio coralii TaxID=294935 RepID=A0A135I597_9GAMM|nr:hypothetical protein ATN88_08145 [Enterovibrio coralii]
MLSLQLWADFQVQSMLLGRSGMFSDDQPVSITGYITLSLGGEIYIFQDVTGVIHVEIDQDANNAQNQSRYPRRN